MLKPVSQLPRYRLAADQIAAQIDGGTLRPGDKMPTERELVEKLGVSRATVREAIIALEIMGYVESRFSAGVIVSDRKAAIETPMPVSSTSDQVDGPFEMLEARRIVEGEIAALAAVRITPSQIDTLWRLTQAMEEHAGQALWNETADAEFHAAIAEAAGNAPLARIAADFWTQQREAPMWQAIWANIDDANLRPKLVSEHEEIIAALTEGESDAARAAMHAHLGSFSETLLDSWKKIELLDR